MKGVDLFKDISGQEVSNIAQIAKEREFSADETIMNHGDNGDSMFIIISGSVKVHIDDKELTTLSKGDCIGEMALLDQEPRSASITTGEGTAVIKGGNFKNQIIPEFELKTFQMRYELQYQNHSMIAAMQISTPPSGWSPRLMRLPYEHQSNHHKEEESKLQEPCLKHGGEELLKQIF